MAPFGFDRTFAFAVTPAEFWATINRTDRYPEWWGWLREFESDGLHSGSTTTCAIRAPLPYTLRCTIRVEQAVPNELLDAVVSGDLEGPARLELAPDGDGCAVRLVWSFELRAAMLRRLAVLGRPAMVWAHDRVIAAGFREFERRALAERVDD